jgi:general secretion pathway protein K
MWLSAALAAFGFALASTVRGEIERASTDLDSLRAYYVASGAIERASLELLWSVMTPTRRLVPQGSLFIDYAFETGVAHVEFLPEAGKLNVNAIPPERLVRLLLALGVDPIRSESIAANLVAWRTPGVSTLAVPMNLGVPTFETPHASFQGIEEILNVQGVTPELFYGTYAPAPPDAPAGAPRLQARPGLVDCLSVFGGKDYLDINTVEPALLLALGTPPEEIAAIVEARRQAPIPGAALGAFPPPSGFRFQAEGNSIVTIRATAQARLPNGGISDVKRTVAAMVKYMPPGYDSPIHALRWYDTAFSGGPWKLSPTPIPFGAPPIEAGSN